MVSNVASVRYLSASQVPHGAMEARRIPDVKGLGKTGLLMQGCGTGEYPTRTTIRCDGERLSTILTAVPR